MSSNRLPDGDGDTVYLDVDATGIIRDCSLSALSLLGYRPIELHNQHICNLLCSLEDGARIQRDQIAQRLKFLCHCGVSFLARRIDGRQIACRLYVHNRNDDGQSSLRLILRREAAAGGLYR